VGRLILDQALIADKKAKELGADHFDYPFYFGKVQAARYFLKNVVPNVMATAGIVKEADSSVLDVPIAAFEF